MTGRRGFITMGAMAAASAGCSSIAPKAGACGGKSFKPITIAKTDCLFEREPMVRPFGFKGVPYWVCCLVGVSLI